jgi:hypothetical protein
MYEREKKSFVILFYVHLLEWCVLHVESIMDAKLVSLENLLMRVVS